MTWTLPRTWVTDEVVTSAQLNTHVRDNLLSVSHPLGREYTSQGPTNTTAETSLYATAPLVLANSLGSAGTLEALLTGETQVGAAGTQVTVRVKFGGSTVVSSTWTDGSNAGTAGVFLLNIRVENLGATNSQRTFIWANTTASRFQTLIAHGTSSVDTTANQTFDVTVQWTTASASVYTLSTFRKHLISQN